jgi:dipeptidase D
MSLTGIEPKVLWNNFSKLNAIPRPSKKEERVIAFMIEFGKSLGLETIQDRIGNVIIKKPATSGMEQRKTVILQSHLDMVHQKNASTVFDFDNQGIEMIIDGDWVKANGTTLGADNGIGVAAIMAVLESSAIVHPAIEAMFTIDEETGMTGAMQLDPSNFEGEILLNLDTEDDDELSIGCAGGIDTNTEYSCSLEDINSDSNFITINVSGLIGGHSGMDIDKGRGNANKIITRILLFLNKSIKFQLISIDGGSLRNAIPREANAVIAYDKNSETELNQMFQEISDKIITEFQEIEGELVLKMTSCQSSERAVSEEDKMKILNTLTTVHNGVFRMSPEIDGLVETSSSLARVILKEGLFSTQSLQRSSVESTKDDVANTIRACFELMGCDVVQNGDYPGWKPNPNSEILQLMADMYRQRFNEEPQIKACHAGLECGILLKHLPNVDMISFGPNIRAAHSPDEKVQISSVSKFWDFFLEVLNQTPAK